MHSNVRSLSGLFRALNQQRTRSTISTIISADAIGNLPRNRDLTMNTRAGTS